MNLFAKWTFLAAIGLITACGGGSSDIYETDSGLRPARRYLDKLESLSTKTERDAYLISLRGHAGLDLNWQEFWSILDSSPKKPTLLAENRESLLGLHSVDCRLSFYRSYIRFVLSNVDDGRYIYGRENHCGLPVGQEAWGDVIQKYFTAAQPSAQRVDAFQWLTREIEVGGSTHAWRATLSAEAIANLRNSFDRLLDSGGFEVATRLDSVFERNFDWSPVRSNLHLYLLRESSDSKLLDGLPVSFLMSFLDFELGRFSDVAIVERLKPILHRVVRMHKGAPTEFVSKLLALTAVVSRLRLPMEGVRYTNLLQGLALEWLQDRTDAERKELLSVCLSHLETPLAPPHRLQVLWLALQTSDRLNAEDHRTYLSNSAHEEFGEEMLLPYRVLRQRLRMQYAPISSVGREARAYCEMLLQSGFSDRSISAANFPGLVPTLEAGCIFIKPSAPKLSIDGLKLPADSLIVLPNQDLEIVSRRLDVGMMLNRALFDSLETDAVSRNLTLTVEDATDFPVFGFSVHRNLAGVNR